MKKNYFTPVTKVMNLNVRKSFMEEGVAVVSEPGGIATDEPMGMPMF